MLPGGELVIKQDRQEDWWEDEAIQVPLTVCLFFKLCLLWICAHTYILVSVKLCVEVRDNLGSLLPSSKGAYGKGGGIGLEGLEEELEPSKESLHPHLYCRKRGVCCGFSLIGPEFL